MPAFKKRFCNQFPFIKLSGKLLWQADPPALQPALPTSTTTDGRTRTTNERGRRRQWGNSDDGGASVPGLQPSRPLADPLHLNSIPDPLVFNPSRSRTEYELLFTYRSQFFTALT
ncbi:unnamed protein product [Haemonchus placei]|uniref:Uncharacterized protein n=1 Tax=Haemonchus placei TaxID=6290 RepID=A0A0N4W0N6_HAEPC|nr:unnamed protein product [Haemonchus placei]